jgi:hypothetical protein
MMVPDHDDPEQTARDPGLARERTELAWNRSGLAVAVTVAIVLRRLWPLHGDRQDLTLALIAGGASFWVVGMRLSRRLAWPGTAERSIGESGCRIMTLGTVLLAVAGLVGGIL